MTRPIDTQVTLGARRQGDNTMVAMATMTATKAPKAGPWETPTLKETEEDAT